MRRKLRLALIGLKLIVTVLGALPWWRRDKLRRLKAGKWWWGLQWGSGMDHLPGNGSHPNPYVAFEDGANSQKATVMQYSGGSWVEVGTAGFSTGVIQLTSLAIYSICTPTSPIRTWQMEQSHGNEILRWLLGRRAPGFSTGEIQFSP